MGVLCQAAGNGDAETELNPPVTPANFQVAKKITGPNLLAPFLSVSALIIKHFG
jgi:hypothetical protein